MKKEKAIKLVRPIKYLLVKEFEETPPEELPNLQLDTIRGIVTEDLEDFSKLGIDHVSELADSEYGKLKGKELSDFKINRGISYAIDIMIHSKEPGVHEEIMPIDELLDRDKETTPPAELADLPTVDIEGVAQRGEAALKKIGIKTIKEFADSDMKDVKKAKYPDWEAEKYLEYARWIMEYAELNIEKPKMENIESKVDGDTLIINFDVTKEFGPSATGKTTIVAHSHGGQRIKGTDLGFNMFAFKYPTKKTTKPKKTKEMQNIDVSIDGNIEP